MIKYSINVLLVNDKLFIKNTCRSQFKYMSIVDHCIQIYIFVDIFHGFLAVHGSKNSDKLGYAF